MNATGSDYSIDIVGHEGTSIYIEDQYQGEIEGRQRKIVDNLSGEMVYLRAEKSGYNTVKKPVFLPRDNRPVVLSQESKAGIFAGSNNMIFAGGLILVIAILVVLFIPVRKYIEKINIQNNNKKNKKININNNSYKNDEIEKKKYNDVNNSDYKILKRIGVGGMAETYLAKYKDNGEYVAIKYMTEDSVDDQELYNKFEKEAEALQMISDIYKNSSPPIVSFIEKGLYENKRPYIVMEYVDGESIKWYSKKGRKFNINQIIDIGIQIMEGIHAAHSVDIWHNDLSSDNVIIKNNEEPIKIKIIDFGVARVMSSSYVTTGEVFGKPCYVAPEAADGQVAQQSDLYSFGIILYELIEGHPPFDDENPITVYKKHLSEEVPAIKQSVPEDLAELVYDLLQKKPDERPQRAYDVLKRLKSIKSNL